MTDPGRTTAVAILILAAMLSVANPARADERPNSLAPGAWALLFGIENDFLLDAYRGQVAAKYHFTRRSAVQLALGLSFTQDHVDNGFSAGAFYQRYLTPGKQTNIYFGLGPTGEYWETEFEERKGAGRLVTFEREWALGVGGAIGAEFFLSRSVSLQAEYETALLYASLKHLETLTQEGFPTATFESGGNGWEFRLSRGVVFGLSVYF